MLKQKYRITPLTRIAFSRLLHVTPFEYRLQHMLMSVHSARIFTSNIFLFPVPLSIASDLTFKTDYALVFPGNNNNNRISTYTYNDVYAGAKCYFI